jgi:hypothetical protein
MSKLQPLAALTLATMTSLLAIRPAAAQAILHQGHEFRSPQHWSTELRLGPYRPDVDSEFSGAAHPHRDLFGTKRRVMTQLELDYQFFQGFGSVAVGLSLGYFRQSAKAFELNSTARSSDTTKLSLTPMALLLIYRFDVAAKRWDIPLVPYAKIGINYTVWSITDVNGKVATSNTASGKGRGGTAGWQAAAGVALGLNWLDPGSAREFDTETGVNDSYFFIEAMQVKADKGLGQDHALHVGDTTWMAGLLFEF